MGWLRRIVAALHWRRWWRDLETLRLRREDVRGRGRDPRDVALGMARSGPRYAEGA